MCNVGCTTTLTAGHSYSLSCVYMKRHLDSKWINKEGKLSNSGHTQAMTGEYELTMFIFPHILLFDVIWFPFLVPSPHRCGLWIFCVAVVFLHRSSHRSPVKQCVSLSLCKVVLFSWWLFLLPLLSFSNYSKWIRNVSLPSHQNRGFQAFSCPGPASWF